jgi:soluble lytic murein transglycosylase
MRGAGTSHAAAAVWRLGWSAFREGRYVEASGYFERLIGEHEIPDTSRDALSRLRPRYWRARALETRGDARATSEFEALARHFPMSYYGWRAAKRTSVGRSLQRPQPIEPGTPALTTLELQRPGILLAAGMLTEARDDLDRLYPRADSLVDRIALARLYSDAGDYHRAQRLMLSGYNDRLSRRPAIQDVEVWWHAWPAPYDGPFRETAESGIEVEPGLVYAVMREESGYLPEVVSVSGARGLLQIMPSTAERLAEGLAIQPFGPDDLFDPGMNIRLGSAYLAQLLQRFEGRASAAIASYNAGPEAVARWIAAGPVEDDEWIEAIPYDQTRTYVKRVLRSLHAYRVLY